MWLSAIKMEAVGSQGGVGTGCLGPIEGVEHQVDALLWAESGDL